MKFNSAEYLAFLPMVLLLHWIMPHRWRWALLLAASWLFYFSWDPMAGLLLVITTAATWLCALGISRGRARRFLLFAALCASLGVLIVFKYTGFFASVIRLEDPVTLMLPVGISFYTFQTMAYVLDVYRGRINAERHFGYYALFVTFFPQLVAGPIERPERLIPQLRSERKLSPELCKTGGKLLLTGYFKKVVVADTLAPLVDAVFAEPGAASGPGVILATVLFGIQIYCDFSGYTDIARGSARLLGVELTENFDRPYSAMSVRDFWRRWHISLTSWFTDYVYIPLGGSRRGLARQLFAVTAVFLLSGLWHGAGWSFVLWGALHGLFMIAEILVYRNKNGRGFGRALTLLLVFAAWLPFRAQSLSDAAELISRLPVGWGALPVPAGDAVRAALCIGALWVMERCSDMKRSPERWALAAFFAVTAIMLAWLSRLAAGGDNAFIYFQF